MSPDLVTGKRAHPAPVAGRGRTCPAGEPSRAGDRHGLDRRSELEPPRAAPPPAAGHDRNGSPASAATVTGFGGVASTLASGWQVLPVGEAVHQAIAQGSRAESRDAFLRNASCRRNWPLQVRGEGGNGDQLRVVVPGEARALRSSRSGSLMCAEYRERCELSTSPTPADGEVVLAGREEAYRSSRVSAGSRLSSLRRVLVANLLSRRRRRPAAWRGCKRKAPDRLVAVRRRGRSCSRSVHSC